MPERIGHLGSVGSFFDNLGEAGTIIRPRSVVWHRRAIVWMPRWFYLLGLAGFLGLGVAIGSHL